MSFLGLGATASDSDHDNEHDDHNDDDDDDDDNSSLIHMDSDDDPIHDDDVDIGFRRHQYETAGSRKRPRRSRQQAKDDAIYGVFNEPERKISASSPGAAPLFVPASRPTTVVEESQNTTVTTNLNQDTTSQQQRETLDLTSTTDDQPPPSPSPEQQKIQLEQQAADEYFQSLLQQAQTRNKRRRDQTPADKVVDVSTTVPNLDFHAASKFTTVETVKKDPRVATWEKHEKGIGSKLLFKMGWKGEGGLGSNRRKLQSTDGDSSNKASTTQEPKIKKGISRPVEVVVRPANLGLGYGNFKEMSKLKTNLQIEAEVRGIELPKPKKKRGILDDDDYENNDEEYDALGPSTTQKSSAIPSTQQLMTQKAWKRRKAKQPTPKIIPYQELVKTHETSDQPVIIDMRGPSFSTKTETDEATPAKTPLGEELLHNVTFMLNTHENMLHSYSQIVTSTRRKEESLQSEIADLKRQQSETKDRREKLENAMSVVQKVENLTQEASHNHQILEQVIRLIQELGETFTPQDRAMLKFWQTIAPALLSPILQYKLQQWDPLGPTEKTKQFLDSILHLQWNHSKTQDPDDKRALDELQNSIFQQELLPRIKQVLESSQWDPSQQIDIVLDLYEHLQSLTKSDSTTEGVTAVEVSDVRDQVLSGGPPDEDHMQPGQTNTRFNRFELVRKDLIMDTIYPKLQTTLNHWKPTLQPGNRLKLEQRLDLWILPWIPHLDHPAILPNLLSDCKRKLKSSFSYLQRKIGKVDDMDFVRAAKDILKPWIRVYDPSVIQRMGSEYITPYLARALSQQEIHRDAHEQDWKSIHLTLELYSLGILSSTEFLSIMEAELLRNWASRTNEMLLLQEITVVQAARNYCLWKGNVMRIQLIKTDDRICRVFYTILRMIELAFQSKMDDLEDLHPPTTSYHVAAARRTKDKQNQAQDDYVRMESRSERESEARLRLRRRHVDTPSFRDVVEEIANERGILFQPRMGARAFKDGKQIFEFGDIPIYIEGDVIFASGQKASTWQPTSLDQLLESAGGRE